ncbi:hypothetical protein KKG65_01000 [Patescibacteria group bacterium]|nr:hypothetical protein [Patescibacteria group bacterium]
MTKKIRKRTIGVETIRGFLPPPVNNIVVQNGRQIVSLTITSTITKWEFKDIARLFKEAGLNLSICLPYPKNSAIGDQLSLVPGNYDIIHQANGDLFFPEEAIN